MLVPAAGGAPAAVEACRLLGATTLVHLTVADGAGGLLHLHARLPPGAALIRGQQVTVTMDPERRLRISRPGSLDPAREMLGHVPANGG